MNTRGYSRQDQQGLLGALRTFQYRRRRPISLLSAFMLMAAVLAPITLIASPANAATVNLTDVQAQVRDHKGTLADYTTASGTDSDNCIRYATRSPQVAGSGGASGFISNPKEALTAHGRPSGSGCPSSLDTTKQSAIGVSPVAGSSVTVGTPFPLSLVTHYNNPIDGSYASYFTGKLDVKLFGFDSTPTLTYDWRLWETPNQASPCAFPNGPNSNGCADQVVFTNQIPNQILTKGGASYKLVVNGFSPVTGSTCPTTMPANTITQFLTKESDSSKACIYATLARVRSLVIKKQVTTPISGATIPSTTFAFTSSSDRLGSPWDNRSFSLTPTQSTPAQTAASELIQGETVTVDEAVPSADTWELTDIVCTDGTGANVPITDKNLAAGSFKLEAGEPASVAAEPITCTYTNTYTPKASLTLKKTVDGGSAQPTAWTLTANGPSPISGASGAASVTGKRVTAGTYALGESGGPAGYVLDGWSCKTAAGGNVAVTNGNVTIADGANVTCTANNRYARGKFQITKSVTGPAGGFTGTNSTPFSGTYTCTGGIGPVNFTVTQATPYLSPEYPAGTICTVTETQPTGNLADSSWSWNAPGYNPANKQATIVDGQVPTVAIANTFAQDSGDLKITKRIDARPGAAVSDYTGGTRTFPITYTCKIGANTVKTGTVNLAKDGTTTITGVPATASCALTEPTQTTQAGDFVGADVAWDGYSTSPVTVVKGQLASAELTNWLKRETGTLTIAKQVDGAGYTGGTGKNFKVNWTCGTKSGQVTLANNGSESVTVPARTQCTVDEVAPSGNLLPAYEWGTPTYDPSATPTVPAGETKLVTVHNHTVPIFGQVKVTKKIAGSAAGVDGSATFPITVSCNAPAQGQAGNYSNTFNLNANGSGTTPNLPVGTACSVSEAALSQGQLVDESYAWAPKPGDQNVTISAKNQTVSVDVTNTVQRAHGTLKVTKVVQGMDGHNGAGVTFSGTWSCKYGNDPAVTGNWSTTGAGSDTVSTNILLTSDCSVTGENAPSAPPAAGDASYIWGSPTIGSPVTLTKANSTGEITVIDPVRRTFGAFSVGKTVTGGAAGVAFEDGNFTFHYVCTPKSGSAISGDLTAKAGQTANVAAGLIPSGSDCVVTETGKPAAKNPFTWDSSTITPNNGHFTVTDGQAVSVTVTNAISLKTVKVNLKKVVQDTTPPGHTGNIDFKLSLVCSLNGVSTTYGPIDVKAGATGQLDVPLGSDCSITEANPTPGQGLADASFAWDAPTFSGSQVVSSTTGSYTFTATNHVKRVRGPIALNKVLTDPDGVVDPNRTYSGGWTCKRAGDPDVSGTWTINGAGAATLTGVPAGGILLASTCTPTEAALSTAPSADGSYYWDAPTLAAGTTQAGKTGTMTVTNTVLRHTGKLTVKKVLTGETAGYVGTGPQFRVDYTCNKKLPSQSDIIGNVTIAAGAAAVTLVDNVPVGWNCNIAEAPVPPGLLADASFAWGASSVSDGGSVTVASTPTEVTVTNPITRVTGNFGVTKAIVADPGVVKSTAVFTGTYECKYDGKVIKSGTWSVTGSGAATMNPATTGLPATTSCSAHEDSPSESGLIDDGWTWDKPVVGADVTVGGGGPVVITVTNKPKRVYGALSVTKSFQGNDNVLLPDAKVNGVWSCKVGSTPVANGVWELPAAGGTAVLFKADGSIGDVKVPVTADCTVGESTPSGGLIDGSYAWNSPSYNPANGQVTLTRNGPNQVGVTNSVKRVYGSFKVTKAIALPEGATKATGQIFTGTYQCVYGADAPVTGDWSITGEGSDVIDGILIGSECKVTGEGVPSGPPSADPSYVWDGHSVSPATVTVGTGETPVKLQVTNKTKRVSTGLSISKELAGDKAGEPAEQTYSMAYKCIDASGGEWTGSKSISAGETWETATNIPLGSGCEVTEGALPDVSPRNLWGPVGFTVTGGQNSSVTGQKVTFDLPASAGENGPTRVGVKVTNTLIRQGAGYILNKTADPASGTEVQPGDKVKYTVTVTSTGKGTVDDVTITDDLSEVNAYASLGNVQTSTGTAALVDGDNKLTWSLGTISGLGTTYTLTYEATVDDDAWGATLKNHVTGIGEGEQPPGECETCTTTTEHPVPPKWTLEKSSDPETGSMVETDTEVTYTLKVTNRSGTTALPAGTVISDNLEQVLNHAAWVGFVPGYSGTASQTGNALEWTLPAVPANSSLMLSYKVHVNSDAFLVQLTNVASGAGVSPPSTDCSTNEEEEVTCKTSTTHFTPAQVLPPVVNPPAPPAPGVKPPKGLPNTGGPGVGWIYGGAAMVLLGGGVLLFLRRRNQPEG